MNERKESAADDVLEKRAKALFDESIEHLDGETLSRLNRGRHRALEELHARRARWVQWTPAVGVAAAAVVAVVIVTGDPAVDEIAPPAMATDLEILLTEDSLEMLEDLEFYSWIELDEETDEILEPDGNVG